MRRLHEEQIPNNIDSFLIDKQRIISCGAFRKLAQKTQVFSNEEFRNDYHRTRLTHTIEVAHFAVVIAQQISQKIQIPINFHLTEAISLAHDMGHPPFGHLGEKALDEISSVGFDHNAQVLRILTQIERRDANYKGINLTLETLDGILKHNGKIKKLHQSIVDLPEMQMIDTGKNGGLEAQISAIADDITYCLHDLDDGLREGFFTVQDLLQFSLIKEFFAENDHKELDQVAIFRPIREKAIFFLIEKLVANTQKRIQDCFIKNTEDIKNHSELMVALPENLWQEIIKIKKFLSHNMYDHKSVMTGSLRGSQIIKNLYKIYSENPKLLPNNWFLQSSQGDSRYFSRTICDYIAGMTDRYALKEHQDLYV